jgi:hypothetical protein
MPQSLMLCTLVYHSAKNKSLLYVAPCSLPGIRTKKTSKQEML